MAALVVVLLHALRAGPALDPHYRPVGNWLFLPPGHLSVLIFFMLSGYVIGLTNPAPISTGRARGRYLRKRLVRLYPLYLVALLATAALTAGYYPPLNLPSLISSVFFLQGLVADVPARNLPLWSLPYEVAYYLLFLLVSARHWRADWMTVTCLGLGLAGTWLQVQPPMLVAVAYGGVFWFGGLALAYRPPRPEPPAYGTMLAFLLLLLCYERLDIGHTVLQKLGLDIDENKFTYFERAVQFSHLSALLLGVPLLASFANRALPGSRWLTWAAFAIPGLCLLGYSATGRLANLGVYQPILLAACLYGLALAAYLGRHRLQPLGQAVVQGLSPLGSISYALYIIHYPLLCLAHQVPGFSGTAATFAGRLVGYLCSVLALSWLLERRLQPWLKMQFAPPPATSR